MDTEVSQSGLQDFQVLDEEPENPDLITSEELVAKVFSLIKDKISLSKGNLP